MSPDQVELTLSGTVFARALLSRVGNKSSVLIVSQLAGGPKRFNELRRAIGGISPDTLTLALKNLEKDGLISRTAFAAIPPRVDYELTPLGRTLLEPAMALIAWADRYQGDVEEAQRRFEQAEPVDHGRVGSPQGISKT